MIEQPVRPEPASHTRTLARCASDQLVAARRGQKRALSRTLSERLVIELATRHRVGVGVKPAEGPLQRAKQAFHGRVFEWVPDVGQNCCRRRCQTHYTDAQHSTVLAARNPLFDANLSRDELRGALTTNWKTMLTLPDGMPMCLKMACRVFSCSKSMMYPGKRAKHTRAEVNTNRATKEPSVIAWFKELKAVTDGRPGMGGYILGHPNKTVVYQQYELDAKTKERFVPVSERYFNAIWLKRFPEVQVRKHSNLSDCRFCRVHRGVLQDHTVSDLDRERTKEKLRQHHMWTAVRERGLFKSKQDRCIANPDQALCISLSSTHQFPQGFPHFLQRTKVSASGVRMTLNIQIGIEAGQAPVMFCAWEFLRMDPNWTIEALDRMIRHAEDRRKGKLPPTLYVQLDNMVSVHKNTYVICWLAWLLERGVFKVIYLSFLPPGHTHSDNDLVASRIYQAVRFVDIKSVKQLVDTLSACSSPRPSVEWVANVQDVTTLFNPSLDGEFPVDTARVVRMPGCDTTIDDPSRMPYMDKTSTLHWWFRNNDNKEVVVQHRLTADHALWSEPESCWNPAGSRPDDREFTEGTSGLMPADLRLAHLRPLPKLRAFELEKSMAIAMDRCSPAEQVECRTIHQILVRVKSNPVGSSQTRAPEHGGLYGFQTNHVYQVEDSDEPSAVADGGLELPPMLLYPSAKTQREARQRRKAYGYTKRIVTVGDYVAYATTYTATTTEDQKQDFWVGLVLSVDVGARTLTLKMYHTGARQNGKIEGENRSKYKLWTGSRRCKMTQTVVHMKDVYESFQLTGGKRIKKTTLRHVMAAKALRHTDHASYDDEPIERGNISEMDRGKNDAPHVREEEDSDHGVQDEEDGDHGAQDEKEEESDQELEEMFV
jgi:hypothetical protein